MSKRRRESGPDVSVPAMDDVYQTVFVDTNLNTQLAMLVSISDTVSDFKEKIVSEHLKVYPEVGGIEIRSVKANRRGKSYPLPDFILISSAFQGVIGNWFLSADVSSSVVCNLNQKPSDRGISNVLEMDARSTSESHGGAEKNFIPVMTNGLVEVDKSSEATQGLLRNSYVVEERTETMSPVRKKRKMNQNEDVRDGSMLENDGIQINESVEAKSQPKTVHYARQGKLFVSEGAAQASSGRTDQPGIDGRVALEGGIIPDTTEKGGLRSSVNFETLLSSDKRKENIVLENIVSENSMAGKSNEHGKNDQTVNSKGVTVEESNLLTGLVDNSSKVQDAKSGGRRKKKRAKKSDVQDAPDLENEARIGEIIEEAVVPEKSSLGSLADSQNILASDKREENTVLPGKNIQTDSTLLENAAFKEPGPPTRSIGSDGELQDGKPVGKRKKAKRKASKIQDTSNLELKTTNDGSVEGACLTAPPEKSVAVSQNILPSDVMKENIVVGNIVPENAVAAISDSELIENVHKEHSQDMLIKKTDVSMVDTSGAIGDAKSDGRKRKKKKSQKTTASIQDLITEKYDSGNVEFFEPISETHRYDTRQKKEHSSQDLVDANKVMEPIISTSSRGKRRGKKSAAADLEKSGMELTVNDTSDHIPEVTGYAESVLYHDGKGIQTKLLDRSVSTNDKVQCANGSEVNFGTLTQTEQTLEDVGSQEKDMGPKNHTSVNSTDFLVLEKENTNLESNQQLTTNVQSNQMENNDGGTGNMHKKAKRKKKKNQLIASDAQGNLPINDLKVGNEIIATEVNLNNVQNSEQEQGLIASSQVLSDNNQEKPEEMPDTPVTNDDQEISFRQYFVPGGNQDAVASGNTVKEASKSNGKMTTEKKVKSRKLPFASTSSEQQNSLRSRESQENENNSRNRREKQDIMTTEKSSLTEGKNTSLSKSSSKMSGTLTENRGDKRWQSGVDLNYAMVTKTTLKKSLFSKPRRIFDDDSSDNDGTNKVVGKESLLAKPGSIFQENSGEGSGDENENVQSNASTRTPSESSSQSGDSEGESDFSQHPTRNGSKLSNGGNGRLTDREGMSKLNLSASEDLSMDVILRSSKRYKKAKKLLALQSDLEQNESQQIEFVPESQPNP